MKKMLLSFFVLSLLALNSHADDVEPLQFPSANLTMDVRRADPYILKILKEHEKEFPGAIRYRDLFYYTDINRLSRVQQNVLWALHQQTDFAQQWQAKKNLSDITATVLENSGQGQEIKVLDTWNWDSIRARMADFLSMAVSAHPDQSEILEILREYSEERLAEAKSHPSDWILTRQAGRTLALNVLVHTWLQQQSDLSIKDLKFKVRELEVGSLDYLHDPLVYEPVLAKLKDPKAAEECLKNFYNDVMEDIYKRSGPIPLVKGQTLKLREVHPNIAIFRGYVGNDCSTSFSPGFVFTPSDRYFYIFDGEGKSLGYLGLSLVTIDKKPAVFIHTIQGPDITSAQTEIAMRAMTLAAPQLFQTDLVVLGPTDSIASNVNFFPIREAMIRAVEKQSPMKMEFSDRTMRKIIANLDSTLQYDDPGRNHSGRKLEFEKPELVKVEIVNKNFEAKFQRPAQSANLSECEKTISKK